MEAPYNQTEYNTGGTVSSHSPEEMLHGRMRGGGGCGGGRWMGEGRGQVMGLQEHGSKQMVTAYQQL